MSRSKICAHCFHFRPNDDSTEDHVIAGMCTRFPPVPMILQQPPNILTTAAVGMAGVNPPVVPGHTCGEFLDSQPLTLDA